MSNPSKETQEYLDLSMHLTDKYKEKPGECPYCGMSVSEVIKSIGNRFLTTIERNNECLNCGKKWIEDFGDAIIWDNNGGISM